MELMKNKYGMGRLYPDPRTGIYQSVIPFHGKRLSKSTGERDYDRAYKIHMDRWAKAKNGLLESSGKEKILMRELFADQRRHYVNNGTKTLTQFDRDIAGPLSFFAEYRAVDVGNALVQKWASKRLTQVSRSAVRREIAVLHRALTLAFENEKLTRVPFIGKPKKDPPRETFYEWHEVVLLSEQLPEPLRRLPLIFFFTGWRLREILLQEWTRVDFNECYMWMPGNLTKSGKYREYPFNRDGHVYQILMQQRNYTNAVEKEKGDTVKWLFHREGQQIIDFREAWKNAHKRAGLQLRKIHDLRRAATRLAHLAGADEDYAMKVIGHESRDVHSNYAGRDREALRETTAKMDEYVDKIAGGKK